MYNGMKFIKSKILLLLCNLFSILYCCKNIKILTHIPFVSLTYFSWLWHYWSLSTEVLPLVYCLASLILVTGDPDSRQRVNNKCSRSEFHTELVYFWIPHCFYIASVLNFLDVCTYSIFPYFWLHIVVYFCPHFSNI